jgi:hypothetical protein
MKHIRELHRFNEIVAGLGYWDLVLIEEEPERFERNRTACIEDLMGPGSDPVPVHQFVGNTELIRGFGLAEDPVEAINLLLNRLGTHEFIFQQDQNITGGGSHTTNLF